MALKQYRPTSPGQRQLVLIDRSGLHKGPPIKALTEGLTKNGGRNNTGRVTVRWQGGGHKQRYRIIDFKRLKFDVPATVERLEYDPNRTSFIALIKYKRLVGGGTIKIVNNTVPGALRQLGYPPTQVEEIVLSRCRVCNTWPPASTNSTCIGIWPTAWVAQLRQGS